MLIRSNLADVEAFLVFVTKTGERPASALTGQYYNVVVRLPSGGSLPVEDWGELEVVKR